MLPVLIVALVIAIAYIITVAIIVIVIVTVLVALLVIGKPLFAAYPGAVLLPAVRTTVVVLFVAAFIIFATLLTGGTVLFIGRVPSRLVGLRRG